MGRRKENKIISKYRGYVIAVTFKNKPSMYTNMFITKTKEINLIVLDDTKKV